MGEEAETPDTGDHGCHLLWIGRGHGVVGSSCKAPWLSVPAPWSCSRSCAGEAVQREGRSVSTSEEFPRPFGQSSHTTASAARRGYFRWNKNGRTNGFSHLAMKDVLSRFPDYYTVNSGWNFLFLGFEMGSQADLKCSK